MSSLHVVTLCTGNAARSVMAGIMLEQMAEMEGIGLRVTTAGTHALEGQPMGMRTKEAMARLGELDVSAAGRHRSHQLVEADCATADLIVAMEADHVRYVRAKHPEAAGRTATIRRLVAELSIEPAPFSARLAALGLSSVDLAEDRDVIDPAGGEQPLYDEVAQELFELCAVLTTLLET